MVLLFWNFSTHQAFIVIVWVFEWTTKKRVFVWLWRNTHLWGAVFQNITGYCFCPACVQLFQVTWGPNHRFSASGENSFSLSNFVILNCWIVFLVGNFKSYNSIYTCQHSNIYSWSANQRQSQKFNCEWCNSKFPCDLALWINRQYRSFISRYFEQANE